MGSGSCVRRKGKGQGCRSVGERGRNDTAQVREVGRESDNGGFNFQDRKLM